MNFWSPARQAKQLWARTFIEEQVGELLPQVNFVSGLSPVRLIFFLFFFCVLAWSATVTTFAQNRPALVDLTELGLEELMQLEVTSVSKKEQRLLEAPAAIYVITQEDIRRSGATSIPEALRMVPGVQVARIDSARWAISARGFNQEFANKLQVLIDGRSVYSPLFSGVYWDMQDLMLEDIDRIEVIRGPGATLWGANAVNGVINIISKNAKDTQGGLISAGGGTEERGFGGIRYGGMLGNNIFYRVYLKYFDRDSFFDPFVGRAGNDDWEMLRGGFRLDWDASSRDRLTVQGDLYGGAVGSTLTGPTLSPPFQRTVSRDTDLLGGNILARWSRIFSQRSSLRLQLYYDHTEPPDPNLRESRDTVDLDWQHSFPLGNRHQILWGLGYRLTTDSLENSFLISLKSSHRSQQLFNSFVQDEIMLIDKRLYVTLGTKLEHNDHTGVEVQPSGRLLWTPHQRHAIWAALSRAVRTPSRIEDDFTFNVAVFPGQEGLTVSSLVGNRHAVSEELIAYELGYRLQPLESLFLDFATFYNVYDHLSSLEPLAPSFNPGPPPFLRLAQRFNNKAHGETYGIEVAANWTVTPWWKLGAGYTWFDSRLHSDSSKPDMIVAQDEGNDPHNQLNFRSYINLPWRVEFDTMLSYVDNLPNLRVPSYFRLDLRLGWRATDKLDFSLVGQNLIANRHLEFGTLSGFHVTEVERGMYGKVTWKF